MAAWQLSGLRVQSGIMVEVMTEVREMVGAQRELRMSVGEAEPWVVWAAWRAVAFARAVQWTSVEVA